MKTPVLGPKGFTLIELMIVIAIIGVLAAIAIPQLAVYRTRAYNASAESDLRNAIGVEAIFLDDGLAYGSSALGTLPGTGGAHGEGTELTGPRSPATTAASGALLEGTHPMSGVKVGVGIGLGSGVIFRVDTMAKDASFIAYARHRLGQRAYAFDADSTNMMVCENRTWVGKEGIQAKTATVSTGVMDLTGACSESPAENWTRL